MLSKQSIAKITDYHKNVQSQNEQRANDAAVKACSGLMQFQGKFETKSLFDQMLHDTCKKNGIRMHFHDDAKARKDQIERSRYSATQRERLGIDNDFRSVNAREERAMQEKQRLEREATTPSQRPALEQRHSLERDLFEYQSAKMRFDHKIEWQTEAPQPSPALARMVAQNLATELADNNGTCATALSRYALNNPQHKTQLQASVHAPMQQMQQAVRLSQSGAKVAGTFQKLGQALPKTHQASIQSAQMRATNLNMNAKPMLTVSPTQNKRSAQATNALPELPAAAAPKRAKRKPKLLSEEAMARIDGYGKQYGGAQEFVARSTSRNNQQGMSL